MISRFRLALPLALLACSQPKAGGVALRMSTDLVVPEDVNALAVYVQQLDGSTVRNSWTFEATPLFDVATNQYKVHFATSLVIESRGVDTDRVRVRVAAFADGADGPTIRILREARTTVPTEHVGVVDLSLLWINAGTATDAAPGGPIVPTDAVAFDAFTRFGDGCGPEMTRGNLGTCESIDVKASAASYDPRLEQDPEVPCFDASAAFAPGGDLLIRGASAVVTRADGACTLDVGVPLDATKVNVALRLPGAGYASGVPGLGLRPVAGAAPSGSAVTFPPAFCTHLEGAEVLVSQRAAAWHGEAGICAPWQTGTQATPTAPATPELDASMEPDASLLEDGGADAALDAGDADAGPDSWTIPDGTSVHVSANAVYAIGGGSLWRAGKAPGPFAREGTNLPYDTLHLLGVDGAGLDVLEGTTGTVAYRLDGTTLAPQLVQVCAGPNQDCALLDGGENSPTLRAAPVRGADTIFHHVWATTDGGAPPTQVYANGLDGATTLPLAAGPGLEGGYVFQRMIPSDSGIYIVFVRGDEFNTTSCTPAGCNGSSPFVVTNAQNVYRQTGLVSTPSQLENGSFFAFGAWDSMVQGFGGVALARYVGTTGTPIEPRVTTAVDGLQRHGDVVCWPGGTSLFCRDTSLSDPPADVAVPGIVIDGSLQSDATYIYWRSGTQLRRRAWASLP